MRICFILFTLFLISSCSDVLKVTKERGLINISEIDSYVGDDIYIQSWKVGQQKEEEVSMGFIMKIDIPKFSKKDQNFLSNPYPIDSWVFKITHSFQGRSRDVGLIYLPFKSTIKTTDSFSVRIFYHAAAVSERFRKFHCPAFGHRKKIIDYEIIKTQPETSLYARPQGYMKVKNYALDHIPITFSIGKKIEGTYAVQMALYSHSENKRFSEFINLGNQINITQENEIKVNSCVGIREETHPLPTSREPRIEDIEIK